MILSVVGKILYKINPRKKCLRKNNIVLKNDIYVLKIKFRVETSIGQVIKIIV